MPPNEPADEQARLAALRGLGVLDTQPEETFDLIVRMATDHLEVPIALVTLVDERRQWFKACYGLDLRETARELSFCAHAILGDVTMVVPDALEDERFKDNLLVTGEPHIRFYAGVPLTTSDGHNLGTVCVIDTKPRAGLSDADARFLERLARLAINDLEAGLQAKQTFERQRQFVSLAEVAHDGLALFSAAGRVTWCNHEMAVMFGLSKDEFMRLTLEECISGFVDADGIPLDPKTHPAHLAFRLRRLIKNSELGLVQPEGKLIWVRVSATPVEVGEQVTSVALALSQL